MPYGIPYYGESLYGETSYNPNLIWAIEVDWNGDGYYDGYNEAMRCIGLSIRRGKELSVESSKGFEHADPGEARITLSNYDDRYNYYNTASEYYPNVRQGKFIRIRVADGATGTPVALFTGIITDIELRKSGTAGGTAIFTCKDGWYFLENNTINIPIGTTYTTGTAISAILTAAGWPSIWSTNIDTGVDSLPYFWATNQNARDAIHDLNDSEFGVVRIAGDGTFEFFERGHEPSANLSLTQGDILTDISLPAPWKTTRNKAIVHVYPRELREDVEIYKMGDIPSLLPDETITVWGNLSYSGREVSANTITQPVKEVIYEDKKTIAFVSATKKITDSANGLAVFTNGMKIEISGSGIPANNGVFTVATGGVAGEIVVSENLVDEAAGSSVTITQLISSFTANTAEDGSGSDLSNYVSATATAYGTQVKNIIKNLYNETMYLTLYRIVGDAVDCPNPSTIEIDASGTADVIPFELDIPWIYYSPTAENYATFLSTYLNVTYPFPVIKIENRPELQFAGDLSDRIGLSLSKLGVDASDYKICKIEHEWKIETGQSVVTTLYTERRSAAASGGDVMLNGDFETGDLTNWTQSGASMSVISTDKYEGTYSLKVDTIASGTKTLTSDRVAAIADQTYKISVATKDSYAPDDLHDLQCAVTEIAYIDSVNSTTNYHNLNIVGGYTGGYAFRALYKFDFSAIPAGSIITQAYLRNTLTAVDSSITTNMTLFRCIEAWADDTVTWDTQPEYEPTGVGSYELLSNESLGLKTTDLAPAYMNEMLSSWSDNGFMLVASPEGGSVATTHTVYWREWYSEWVMRGGRMVLHIGYYIRSKTYTVSTTTSNKYTFNNTPYIDLVYNTVAYPAPNYKIEVKWYDDPAAGSLIRTDEICNENNQVEWNIRTMQVNSPATAASFEVVITATQSDAPFYIDDIQVIPIGYY